MPVYEDTSYDYLELLIQFGYVFLFAAVFPLAPLLALANNALEVRSDALKLCAAYQRPNQRAARGINSAWLKAFEVMGVLGVVSNCALLVVDNLAPDAGHNLEMTLLAVSIEHVILAAVLLVAYVVPDMPRDVHVKLLKKHYDRKRAMVSKKKSLNRFQLVFTRVLDSNCSNIFISNIRIHLFKLSAQRITKSASCL